MRAPDDPAVANLRFLRELPLFGGLGENALADLARRSRIRRIARGTIIFSKSDPAEAAYLVRAGSVAIVLASEDGREIVINEMLPGECFGELALLTGQARSTGAVARQDSELVIIPRSVFLALVDAEPRLARRLLEMNARRLGSSSERESALAFLDAPARLARILLDLERLEGIGGCLHISQEELASRASLTRQTVATILGRWRRLGWLSTGRGQIWLLDRENLEKLGM